jgi:hypothetical protein
MERIAAKWAVKFRENRKNRPEPGWGLPVTLPEREFGKVLSSLEQFHLGDGGGPGSLIAFDKGRFEDVSPEAREVVDLWFAEEKEHSRLLGMAVARMGGTPIKSHWSFTCFCLVRKWAGVWAELYILLLTEIVSTAYYRLLKRHCPDVCIKDVCRLILRDESGHVSFHRDRLVDKGGWYGVVWETLFRGFGLAAGTMLWVNHRGALVALGSSDAEFFVEAWLELGRFVRRLRRDLREASAVANEADRGWESEVVGERVIQPIARGEGHGVGLLRVLRR